ncbi:XdhC family protein [Erythrobacter sp. MTPC3]|uniref:XdhC family protein n=1 Tax=Erythrobacter sp. MTPC3 TaxID=3056564 RepID=UPI0036F2A28F
MHFRDVFEFLHRHTAAGEAAVLVTVCAVEGSSMRNPGSVMAVAQDGSYAGSLSGGCIENAVIAEALDALDAAGSRIVRFGAGSRYLDIKLPCGGGLDLHFQPLWDDSLATQCLASINSRAPFSVALSDAGAQHIAQWHRPVFDTEAGTATFGYWPEPRLAIVGHGAGVEALHDMAQAMGCAVQVFTPDDRIAAALERKGRPVTPLSKVTQVEALEGDAWTAFVFLFHDHDWEIDLMTRALELPHFYLGAMGGRKAHQMRIAALGAKGIADSRLNTIRAPIGIFHSSRDPQTLALSTLAEVIRTYQDADFGAGIA